MDEQSDTGLTTEEREELARMLFEYLFSTYNL